MPMPQTKRAQILAHIQSLGEDEFDGPSLANLLDIKLVTVNEYLGVLHQRNQVHITGWLPSGKTTQLSTRVYRMGPGEDTPRPKQSPVDRKASNAAYYQRWLQRQKEEPKSQYSGSPTSVFDLARHL